MHEGNPAAEKKLEESKIRESLNALVVAVRRNGELVSNPGGDFVLRKGDYIGVVGTPDQNRQLVEFFKKPPERE